MSEAVKAVFDQWALEGKDDEMEKHHKHAVREALRLVSVPPTATILDLGCGNGWVTRALAKRLPAATVQGIDVSDEMINIARDLTDDDVMNAVFYCGSILDESLEDEKFDLILGVESIYYMLPVEGHIHRIASLLNDGGQLILIVDYYQENATSHSWPAKVGVDMELHSGEEYVAMFERAGLTDVTQSRITYPAGKGHDAWKVKEGSLVLSGFKPATAEA